MSVSDRHCAGNTVIDAPQPLLSRSSWSTGNADEQTDNYHGGGQCHTGDDRGF